MDESERFPVADEITDPLIRRFAEVGAFTAEEAAAVQAYSDDPTSTGFWGHRDQPKETVKPTKRTFLGRMYRWLRWWPLAQRMVVRIQYGYWDCPPF